MNKTQIILATTALLATQAYPLALLPQDDPATLLAQTGVSAAAEQFYPRGRPSYPPAPAFRGRGRGVRGRPPSPGSMLGTPIGMPGSPIPSPPPSPTPSPEREQSRETMILQEQIETLERGIERLIATGADPSRIARTQRILAARQKELYEIIGEPEEDPEVVKERKRQEAAE